MIRKLLAALILLALVSSASAQRISYRDAKKIYTDEKIENQKYSPIAAGVLSYVFVGSGHIYVGEPLRGLCFFTGQVASLTCGMVGLLMMLSEPMYEPDSPNYTSHYTNNSIKGPTLMILGVSASILNQVFSIIDVVHVAKVKNFAYSQQNHVLLQAKPFFEYANHGTLNSKQPTVGLSLCLKF
ncbi:MAG TPA: hypothetical protein VFC87_00920 [Perlabentimonas sp.]|nr:hypothetical protein [Tenuifilaceae bacterium]HZJ73338.1 hypothetical protein [Perlabentimonas sp.]